MSKEQRDARGTEPSGETRHRGLTRLVCLIALELTKYGGRCSADSGYWLVGNLSCKLMSFPEGTMVWSMSNACSLLRSMTCACFLEDSRRHPNKLNQLVCLIPSLICYRQITLVYIQALFILICLHFQEALCRFVLANAESSGINAGRYLTKVNTAAKSAVQLRIWLGEAFNVKPDGKIWLWINS